jgi:hypothetical protein
MSSKADAVIIDCYVQCLEILFKGRKAEVLPCRALRSRADQGHFPRPADYYSEVLGPWKLKPTLPLVVDISFVYEATNQLVLTERWVFVYSKEDGKALPNRKVQTFVRSLFSFVRLLPAYQLLSYRPINQPPCLYFDIYNTDMRQASMFTSPSSKLFAHSWWFCLRGLNCIADNS